MYIYIYIPTFCLAYLLTFWHLIWHLFWHTIWHMLSDMHSDICSDIIFDSVHGIMSDLVIRHPFWYLIWQSIWHISGHSIWGFIYGRAQRAGELAIECMCVCQCVFVGCCVRDFLLKSRSPHLPGGEKKQESAMCPTKFIGLLAIPICYGISWFF